eukprot:CAMPEP_0177264098 /NCGR_PEP_ID=MMETSP0367-20130122/61355_1 /TAXON_ID=447022 ORGANISM="Scrippsiella hangoei-like, Strain SHHI-4" /NCGR_SAMPLE_ID=MMETSP0367 /ASSEMBLY_ACC=CAM_ASM_000362 /LENGTH=48 /DNA_ID= /DNA_START= /DNA_END= /DNA_ORIENTATION=
MSFRMQSGKACGSASQSMASATTGGGMPQHRAKVYSPLGSQQAWLPSG